jgi:hypothetical protein
MRSNEFRRLVEIVTDPTGTLPPDSEMRVCVDEAGRYTGRSKESIPFQIRLPEVSAPAHSPDLGANHLDRRILQGLAGPQMGASTADEIPFVHV